MKIIIYDLNKMDKWECDLSKDEIMKDISSYEILNFLDKTFIEIVAIQISINKLFGNNARFNRDCCILSRRFGNITNENDIIYDNIMIEVLDV